MSIYSKENKRTSLWSEKVKGMQLHLSLEEQNVKRRGEKTQPKTTIKVRGSQGHKKWDIH